MLPQAVANFNKISGSVTKAEQTNAPPVMPSSLTKLKCLTPGSNYVADYSFGAAMDPLLLGSRAPITCISGLKL